MLIGHYCIADGDVYCYYAPASGKIGSNLSAATGNCLHRVCRQTARKSRANCVHVDRDRKKKEVGGNP